MLLARIILLLVNFMCVYCSFKNTFSVFTVHGNSHTQKKAAENVLTRVLGSKIANLFELKINEHRQEDGFTILKSVNDEKVSITGPNGVSLVWGANFYLKNFCNCQISWDGDRINIPDNLPLVNLTLASVDKLRYYQNVCTSSYSFVWWDWKRWEREIDWMALNGINLALAFTGQEIIWQRVYDALGLEYNEFTGPAFLAWNRMGNLRNFSYGLTSNWHQQQLQLQHKILQRLRDLGITPVLPAFCGIVPRSFEKTFPLANLTKMPQWNKFSDDYCCPFLLDPHDSLFSVISTVFFREYISEFGTNHIYNCDVFNENKPISGNLDYLSNISKLIYKEIDKADPGAVWLIQGWMFLDPFWAAQNRAKAFVTGVPIGKMLILDLQSGLTPQYKRLHSYFGQPFIWCTLHNFGGQLGMYGYLSRVNTEVPKGRKFKNSTMIGIGIAPEGIDQNYIMYEFTLESPFRVNPTNLSEWVSKYAIRRYGIYKEIINTAWLLLKSTVYNYHPEVSFRVSALGTKLRVLRAGEHISKNILTRFPSLYLNEPFWYNKSIIFDVYKMFVSASNEHDISSSELFQHDLIDVTRQTIQTAISGLYFEIVKEYAESNLENFQDRVNTFLDLLDELDVILGSGKKFLLGNWLESAKKLAVNENETTWYEFNARNQITLWGPNGEIRDYAAKQWSGMIADFYKSRWLIFLQALNESIIENVPCNASLIKNQIFLSVEKPFGFDRKVYPTLPRGNTIQIIQEFSKKWDGKLYEIFKNLAAKLIKVKLI